MNNPIINFKDWLESESPSYSQFCDAYKKIPKDFKDSIGYAQFMLRCSLPKHYRNKTKEGCIPEWTECYQSKQYMKSLLVLANCLHEQEEAVTNS